MTSVNPHVIPEKDKPTTGYKMVVLPNGTYGIAVLSIPPKSTVIKTSYKVHYKGQYGNSNKDDIRLLRTNRALVVSIAPLGKPNSIEALGSSMRRTTFKYNLGKYVEADLGTAPVADGAGIHFFEDLTYANMWTTLLR